MNDVQMNIIIGMEYEPLNLISDTYICVDVDYEKQLCTVVWCNHFGLSLGYRTFDDIRKTRKVGKIGLSEYLQYWKIFRGW